MSRVKGVAPRDGRGASGGKGCGARVDSRGPGGGELCQLSVCFCLKLFIFFEQEVTEETEGA